MRVLAVVVLFVSLLAPSAVSQMPDDKLVVPGQRIGKWTLDMTISALEEMNGARNTDGAFCQAHSIYQPVERSRLATPDFAWTVFRHTWCNRSLFAFTLGENGQQVGALGTFLGAYGTVKGLKVGDPPQAFEAAYGKPTVASSVRMIYDESGWAARISSYGTVIVLFVFRPGTAKSIWEY